MRSNELLMRVSDGFADVCESIEDLGCRMEEGLALVADVLTDQLEVLTEISEKLSAINETLQNPIVTQAREFVRLGFKCLMHGLYREAFEKLHKAEELNSTDAALQLQLGKLYLYAVDHGTSLVNLAKAEHYLLLAERYATLVDSKQLTGHIEYHLAQLYFIFASERMLLVTQQMGSATIAQGWIADSRNLLAKCEQHTRRSLEVWPALFHTRYLLARSYAHSGQKEQAWEELLRLGDLDRRYWRRAAKDESFRGMTLPTVADIRKMDPDYSLTAATEKMIVRAKGLIEESSKWALTAEEQDLFRMFGEGIADAERAMESRTFSALKVFPRAFAVASDAITVLKKKREAVQSEFDKRRNRLDDRRSHSLQNRETARDNLAELNRRLEETEAEIVPLAHRESSWMFGRLTERERNQLNGLHSEKERIQSRIEKAKQKLADAQLALAALDKECKTQEVHEVPELPALNIDHVLAVVPHMNTMGKYMRATRKRWNPSGEALK